LEGVGGVELFRKTFLDEIQSGFGPVGFFKRFYFQPASPFSVIAP
jgi:hypothetical protein